MKRYNDQFLGDEDGVWVQHKDMLDARIEMQKKHLETVIQYQETVDALRAELNKVL